MNVPARLQPTEPDLSPGQLLRLAAAMEVGVPSLGAASSLRELVALERGEYLKKSEGLKADERQRLWTLRAGLRALDTQQAREALSDTEELGGTLKEYWHWVIDSAYPVVEPGSKRPANQIPGNLATAIVRDPGRREFVLDSWRQFAGLLRVDDEAVLDRLGRHLDGCRPSDVEAPTPRTLDLGVDIAELTGLPQQLIVAHSDAWTREHQILMATNRVLHDRARRASMEEFSAGGRAEVSLNSAPRTAPLPDGRIRLVLAAPELEILNDEIAGRVLKRLVRTLRRGEMPGLNLSFAAAYSAFVTRQHEEGREHVTVFDPLDFAFIDGPDDSDATEPFEDSDVELDAAEQFVVAQDWLSGAIDASMRQLASQLRASGPEGVFPTASYGKQRSAGFGAAHLRAAQNCLQYLASAAYLNRVTLAPRLPSETDPKAELARHMRSTAPAMWNTTGAARQATLGFIGAVASVAWLAAVRMEPGNAPSIATDAATALVQSLRSFTGLAALQGMAGMLRRYAPPKPNPQSAWCTTLQAGSRWIEELAVAVGSYPGVASHPGLPSVVDGLRELAGQYAAVATATGLPDAGRATARLHAAADRLSQRGSA